MLSIVNLLSSYFDVCVNKIDKSITHYWTWNSHIDLYFKAKRIYPDAVFINLVWDIPFWRIEGYDDFGSKKDWTDFYLPYLEGADILLSASEYTRKTIKNAYGINSDVFYMFFDDFTLRKYYKPVKKVQNKIIGISRFVPFKKFDILINSVRELDDIRGGKHLLTLIGFGEEKKNYRKYADNLKVELKILNNVSKRRLVRELCSSQVLVAPSIMEGDCGWAPCEALFCGVPVVVSNLSFTKEFLKNGSLYAEPDNSNDFAIKISKLLDNQEMQRALVTEGIKTLSFYTIQQSAARFIKLFSTLNKL